MRIQLAICVADTKYLDHFQTFIERNYMDKIEIHSFSRADIFLQFFLSAHIDIALIDETMELDPKRIKERASLAYLSDNMGLSEKNGVLVIGKYKKPDLIYKDIINLYAEKSSQQNAFFNKKRSKSCPLLLFLSFSGGTGASVTAAACATALSESGKKVLYLNLEERGDPSVFFAGEGTYTFEEVIYALKSKRADLRLKMESCVRQDVHSGVYFYAPCVSSLYMSELTKDDILRILQTSQDGGDYDAIVADIDFALDEKVYHIMQYAERIIAVTDGSETANAKFIRTVDALKVIESQEDYRLLEHVSILYNRFSSSRSSSELTGIYMPVLGKIPPIKHALVKEIIGEIQKKSEMFQYLLGDDGR